MANSPQARKRDRQNEKRKQLNRSKKSDLRTNLKKIEVTIRDGHKDEAEALLPQVSSKLDKAVKVGLIHKNESSRRKSKLTKRVSTMK